MKKHLIKIITICLAISCNSIFAQTSPEKPLLIIGGDSIYTSEFVSTYGKNNNLSQASPEDLRSYLNLFINFKLKVKEGMAMQLDTSASFKSELSSYISQSAQQYLTDNDVTEQLYNECVNRAQYHLRASHILINCNNDADPKDTLAAYKKAMKIRKAILKGKDFNEAAWEWSEDISARDFINPQNGRKQFGNKGDISYFTVFNLIYPFETGAYNTPVGEVSKPIRSRFGYHLIYVQDKVPAIEQIYASHILISDTNARHGIMSEEARAKVDQVQQGLNQNIPFAQLVVDYSDDIATNVKAGRMQAFAPNQRAGNFVYATIHLQPGQVSEPVASIYGWHFIKLDSIKYRDVNDDYKAMLRTKLGRDNRSYISRESFIANLKKQYNYDESGKNASIQFFNQNIPAEYFQSTNTDITTLQGIETLAPMATYADQQISAPEFAKYISRFQGIELNSSLDKFLNERFVKFVEERLYNFEKDNLIKKYPDFKELVDEYHDGMILYEINSQKVWSLAITDTAGLQAFYEKVKAYYPIDPNADPVEYKPLSQIKASVISDYQNYLDENWIKELKDKYPVTINEDVFQAILKK